MVSVIVCTYNRAQYIGKCLEHLAIQKASVKEYEIIVVDNNSTDGSVEIIKKIMNEFSDIPFAYFLELNQGHTFARNRGITEAKGEILSFIDDDAFVEENFITAIQDHFNSNPTVAAIGGKIVPIYEGREPTWMSKYLLTLVSALDLGQDVKEFPKSKFPIGANMAFKKEVFEEYGHFNVTLGRRADGLEGGDEKEVFMRLRKEHELIHYVPDVKVDHIIPEKRTTEAYIKGLGNGVGSSEKKRLKNAGLVGKGRKYVSEIIKTIGSFVLYLLYLMKGRLSAANMLLKFRYWVWQGLVLKSKI
ncbi:MAG: glycosyltransferase involved in cell wall biosynthesis [Marivirga sp.]|jgi:glycosyltransferase involved in cell wall biosynthesis